MFVTKVDEALARRAVQDKTVRANMHLEGNQEESRFTFDSGDEEDLRSLLVAFRPFVSEGEDVTANWVYNQLETRLADDGLREIARNHRGHWKQAMNGMVQLQADGTDYRAIDCFDLVVNGHMFHTDKTKSQEYDALPDVVRAMVFVQMTGLVIDGLRVLVKTRGLVQHALDNRSLRPT